MSLGPDIDPSRAPPDAAGLSQPSRVGFGTAALHHLHRQSDRQRLLDAAYEAGIRYFDTAPLYGHGLAERELGVFRSRVPAQDPILISTKVGILPNELVRRRPILLLPYSGIRGLFIRTGVLPIRWQDFRRSFSAATLRTSVARSLESLRLGAIDVLYLHEPRFEDAGQLGAFAEEAQRLRSDGFVKCLGVSGAMQSAKAIMIQQPLLTERLQIELLPSMLASTADIAWVRRYAHSTFGHLRLSAQRLSSNGEGFSLEPIAKVAVAANPFGTILFATSRPERIRPFVEAIRKADL